MCEVKDPHKRLFHLGKSCCTVITILLKYISNPLMEKESLEEP